ncbi:MAG: nucleotidyltransferase family protein [Prevotellaceae bacterium]|jgi:D-glycero-alpha-D-manno-heptose 1-phosphate guanylyltransferase|nr:nucleotidyltransferase family protein [Prevotellaceae bacterium]
MDSIILAGGLGTRLRSAVSNLPKCMATVAGKPFLFYLLQRLNKAKIGRVVISVGYLHEIIEKWVAENKTMFNFEIKFALEDEPLGTGGAIRLAMSKVQSSNALILNGDTLFDIDLEAFAEQHRNSSSALSVALKPMKNFDRYGNVVLENNKITIFKEKEFCADGLINGGIYLINKKNDFFNAMPEKFSFETQTLQPAAGNKLVSGFVFDNYFIDIGIPEDYARANKEFETYFVCA